MNFPSPTLSSPGLLSFVFTNKCVLVPSQLLYDVLLNAVDVNLLYMCNNVYLIIFHQFFQKYIYLYAPNI